MSSVTFDFQQLSQTILRPIGTRNRLPVHPGSRRLYLYYFTTENINVTTDPSEELYDRLELSLTGGALSMRWNKGLS